MSCRFTVAALAAGAIAGFAGPAGAQQKPADPGAPAQIEQEELRAELERARRELEAAAREVARLSAAMTAPVIRSAATAARSARQRALLGLGTEDDARGVRVTGVSPNGPAEQAGLRPGDVIVAVDGTALAPAEGQSQTAAFLELLDRARPGTNVMLEVVAPDGTTRTVGVQARAFADWWPEQFDFDFDFDFDWRDGTGPGPFGFGRANAWRSMELAELTPELGSYFGVERGVLVVRAPQRDGLGLRDGDVILDIGGREPTSPEHAMRILASFEPGETLRMTIMRRQRRETIEIEMPRPER